MEKRRAHRCPAHGRASTIHRIGYIVINFDVLHMVATVKCSFLNLVLDKFDRTFGGVAPSVALTPQKRSPHPWLTWRWGKLPNWPACIRRTSLLGILLCTYRHLITTQRKNAL